MAEIEITGIRKDNGNHDNPNEAIEAYRWIQHFNGHTGITDRETVVGWLDGSKGFAVTAYVERVSPRADCFVNENARGTRFLQTRSDGTEDNNLLRLPEC